MASRNVSALTETSRTTLAVTNDRILAVDRVAGHRPALDLAMDAGTLLAALVPDRAVLVDGAVHPAGLLALALLHFAYSAFCSG